MGTITITTAIISATVLVSLAGIAVFFFSVTRGALLVRSWFDLPSNQVSHIYPIYSEKWLIRFVDFQPLISAILLFQYDKVVDRIIIELHKTALKNKRVLMTSCAFGNVIPRIVRTSIDEGAESVIVTDIIANELNRAEGKLEDFAGKVIFSEQNATCMEQKDNSIDINVIFFLLHELPNNLKDLALSEASRVIAPGGKLIIAEFHRPNFLPMRLLSRAYFKVFEPYAHAIWDMYDPVRTLKKTGKWKYERTTYFFSNFQVVVATKEF